MPSTDPSFKPGNVFSGVTLHSRRTIAGLLVALFLSAALCAQAVPPPSAAASDLVAKTISSGDPDAAIKKLVSAASSSKTLTDKKYILSVLGSFEERLGLYVPAARHYAEAAWATDQRDWSLVLDSARCTIAAGDTAQADSLIKSVLLGCFDEALLMRARVYAALVQLSSSERGAALELCRSYAGNPAFSEYAPMLLFVLWWTESDVNAKKILESSWPETPEASVLSGTSNLSPVPFWYLMDRSSSAVADFAASASPPLAASASPPGSPPDSKPSAGSDLSSTSSAPSAARGIWQQTGFFRNESYAEDLRNKLTGLGFAAIIRSEKRASGTTYYSVLVPEDDERSTSIRLKDAGFECSLVID